MTGSRRDMRQTRTGGRRARVLLASAGLGLILGACGSSGHQPPPTVPTTRVPPPASTTVPLVQTSGPRTVLSPVGLNIRVGPSRSAKVVGTAARGATMTVLGHSGTVGGWYRVKGETLTGWISDQRSLSAPGSFKSYDAGQYAVLYPSTWTYTTPAVNTVTFRPAPGPEAVTMRVAANINQLGRGHAGYRQLTSEVIVACGATTRLDTYAATSTPVTTVAPTGAVAPPPYLAQMRLTLDPHHGLGLDANLTAAAQLQTVRDFINSVTFPYPPCLG